MPEAPKDLPSIRRDVVFVQARGRDLSVSEIAGRVGYGSEAACNKAFRPEVGISPGVYRRPEFSREQVRL